MLQVVFDFPIAIFITQDIFGLEYVDLVNSLLIYLLLAIGADDLFGMLDAWKQFSNLKNVRAPLLLKGLWLLSPVRLLRLQVLQQRIKETELKVVRAVCESRED